MAKRTAAQPTKDTISLRAYQLFASRSYEHGRDVDDWLQAEAQLRAEISKPARTRTAATGISRRPSTARKKSG